MKVKGPLLLWLTSILWGMAFVAQTSAAGNVEPFTFNASRNFVGALFLCGVIRWREHIGQDMRPDAAGSTYTRRDLLIGGTACGVLLCAAAYLQQLGISLYPPEAAASSRAGFVTNAYVIMVALAGLGLGKRPHPLVFVAVALAAVGMYLLCAPSGLGSVYTGDWLVLACAAAYAVHILVIDHFNYVDGVRLSRVQLLTSGMISLAGAALFEHPSLAAILSAAVPMLYAGICSDGIAYTCQIIGQQTTDPTVASIIMSLESVFAALGGWLLLGERLSPVELLGCALVFLAVLLAQVPDFKRQRS